MNLDDKNYVYIRSLLLLCIFLLLHYLYKWFPNVIFSLFCSIDESVYQHFKNAFYSYLILTGVEFWIFHKKINDKKKFIFSHIFSAIIISWVIFILFLIAAMFYGERYFIIEIIYAIIIVYLTAISISIIEQEIKKLEFSNRFKILIGILFVLLILEFTVFTSKLPWHDIFADPYS